jgi:hypothetical protein
MLFPEQWLSPASTRDKSLDRAEDHSLRGGASASSLLIRISSLCPRLTPGGLLFLCLCSTGPLKGEKLEIGKELTQTNAYLYFFDAPQRKG